MLYCSFIELDALLSVIIIIIYSLFSLRSTQVNLADVFLFCRIFPLIFVLGFYMDLSTAPSILSLFMDQPVSDTFKGFLSIDFLLALLLFFVMYNFQSFESILLLLFTFIGQYYMLHSIDLLTFYIALEAQNFCFLVLCGLPNIVSTGRYSAGEGIVNYAKIGNASCENLRFSQRGYFELCSKYPSNRNSGIALASFSSNESSLQGDKTEKVFYRNMSYDGGAGKSNYVFSVEASIKYFLLSAFSSGVLLFWFSAIYLQTGMSILSFSPKEQGLYTGYELSTVSIFLILCAMMFKLGAAPLHLWVVQIYNGVKRNLLLYISTAPKLSLFGFWVNSFQTVWTDYSVILFSIFSIVLGAFGAYSQPSLRTILAYSTVNEIGLLLSALETAGFNSLFQHLGIYIISQILLWNLYDKRMFTVLAVSLAGLPPLAGFFGKIFIFWHLINVGAVELLLFALFCTGISLVYYIRIIRLFWNSEHVHIMRSTHQFETKRPYLTSCCVILLIIIPIFVIKPFII